MCDVVEFILLSLVCVLVTTHLWFQTPEWKISTLAALAFYWLLKYAMLVIPQALCFCCCFSSLTHS